MEDNDLIIIEAGKEAEQIINDSKEIKHKNPEYFWNLKKKILKEKYNIDWTTPKEKDSFAKYD